MGILKELKRRKVFRVAATYGVVASIFVLIAPIANAQPDNCQEFFQSNGLASIPMEISGTPVVARLNTGVLPIGISKALAQDLGYEVEQVSSQNIYWSAIPSIVGQLSNIPVQIFNQEMKIEQMYVMESSDRFINLNLMTFDEFIIQLDFPQSQLCFLSQETFDIGEERNIAMARARGGRYALQVSLNQGEPIWLELQLEFPGAVRLNREAALQLGFAQDDYQVSDGAMLDYMSATANTITFGPYEVGNVAVSYPTADRQGDSDLDRVLRMSKNFGYFPELRWLSGNLEASGIVGYEVLKHFVITLDIKRSRPRHLSTGMHVYAPP